MALNSSRKGAARSGCRLVTVKYHADVAHKESPRFKHNNLVFVEFQQAIVLHTSEAFQFSGEVLVEIDVPGFADLPGIEPEMAHQLLNYLSP